MEMRIGIQQAVTMAAFEQMLAAVLCGDYTLLYAEQLARVSTHGEARVMKIRTVINRLAKGNPLLPFMKEHEEESKHHDHFHMSHPDTNWVSCIEHAKKLGLGTDEYELIEVK